MQSSCSQEEVPLPGIDFEDFVDQNFRLYFTLRTIQDLAGDDAASMLNLEAYPEPSQFFSEATKMVEVLNDEDRILRLRFRAPEIFQNVPEKKVTEFIKDMKFRLCSEEEPEDKLGQFLSETQTFLTEAFGS